MHIQKVWKPIEGTTYALTQPILTYWPSTEPSIKRSTCVNKEKNNGSRWAWDNYIIRCTDGLSQLETICRIETSCRQGAQWPTVEQLSQDEKRVLLWSWEELWVKISLSPSLTHLSHPRNITLSRIKCRRYIFIKKCVRSFIEIRHYCWLCSRLYLYFYMYVAIQHHL